MVVELTIITRIILCKYQCKTHFIQMNIIKFLNIKFIKLFLFYINFVFISIIFIKLNCIDVQ